MAGQELQIIEKLDYPALRMPAAELTALIEENLGGRGLGELELDRVRIPTGGAQRWALPGLAGEQSAEAIEAVIIGQRYGRLYWSRPFGEGGGPTPPDCTSQDGARGFGEPGGNCATCECAQWGSDSRGRGQACKQICLLFLLRSDSLLPSLLALPPTSLRPVRSYMQRLSGAGLFYWHIVTRIGLAPAQSADGVGYSVATFSAVGALRPEQREDIGRLREAMMPGLTEVRVRADDYATEPDDTAGGGA